MKNQPAPAGRPFLGVHMKCCNAYIRAYLANDRTHYAGRCPRCGRQVRINVVAAGGSTDRIFEAG